LLHVTSIAHFVTCNNENRMIFRDYSCARSGTRSNFFVPLIAQTLSIRARTNKIWHKTAKRPRATSGTLRFLETIFF
jgi:hypothetical protein